MPNPKLTHLLRDRERNIAAMVSWSWGKTAKHIDLIDQQLGMAFEQRRLDAFAALEEFRAQVVAARWRKLDQELEVQETP